MKSATSLPTDRRSATQWYTEKLSAAAGKGPDYLHEAKRWLAKNDLFYLMVAVIGRRDLNDDWLFERCREVQANPDGHLDLWAREHYKSTIITFGLTIQDVLNDPEITVGIFSHTRPIAKGFLRQIKREFESNDTLRSLFPEIFWENERRDAPKWSEDDGLIVKRKGNPKESTVEAWGLVDGQPTSKHFKRLIYDDVVTKESVTTPDMIKKTTEAWELSLNLGAAGGSYRGIGTRYHYSDTYRSILDRGSMRPRVYPATKNGKVDGEPVLLSREVLAKKRRDMGPYTFGCQMLQDPKADETQGFKDEWLAFWPAHHTSNLNLYIIVDPASKKKTTNDYTVMTVLGVGDDDCIRVVTWIRDRLSLTQKADWLFRLHREYKPMAVGYEEYGMQADIAHFEDRMVRENYKFTIKPLGGKVAKEDRIRSLIPDFEQQRILLPEHCMRTNYEGRSEDLTKIFLDDEYRAFPVSPHDDMLDCLARIKDPEFPMVEPGRSGRANRPARANNNYSPHAWRRHA